MLPWWRTLIEPWVPYITPAIAVIALAISIASFSTAKSTYIRSGHIVTIWYVVDLDSWLDIEDQRRVYLEVVLRNRGLADVLVEAMALHHFRPIRRRVSRLDFAAKQDVLQVDGPKLPMMIAGNSSIILRYEVRGMEIFERRTKADSRMSDPSDLFSEVETGRLTVMLGDGKEIEWTRWWGVDILGVGSSEVKWMLRRSYRRNQGRQT